MSSQPVLPEDVLLAVLATMDRPDAARMMRASRFLYSEGPKVILSGTITICSDKDLSRFLSFINTDRARRSKFVRSLRVDIPERDGSEHFQRLGVALEGCSYLSSLSVAVHSFDQIFSFFALLDADVRDNGSGRGLHNLIDSLVLQIHLRSHFSDSEPQRCRMALSRALPRMTNLRMLSITFDADLVMSDPDCSSALFAMRSIQTLRLCGSLDNAFSTLKNLRSQLVSVTLNSWSFVAGHDWAVNYVADVRTLHPVELLSHSQSTLTELRTYQWTTHSDIPPDTRFIYPKMRRLDLEKTGLPITMVYINAYPNLSHLRYSTPEVKRASDEEFMREKYPFPMFMSADWRDLSIQRYDERHRFNVTAQNASGRTWAHLEKLCGHLLDLYMLGLTCTVDQVTLHLVASDKFSYMVDPVLTYLCPRSLKLLEGWPGNISGSAAQAFDVFCGKGGSRLEYLELRTCLLWGHKDVDFSEVMEGITSSLSQTRLQELKAEIYIGKHSLRDSDTVRITHVDYHRSGPYLPPPHDPYYPLSPAEHSAECLDLEEWLCSFGQAVSMLRKAEIVVVGPWRRWRRAVLASGEVHYEDKA
ncbi:hypothetical protein PYCCODRAFT_1398369 [Trametes coccinea BRFM310]|uniref:F-box domain-containing protein n=1 Tax=Trametes coccinea (strain BRFM310) TaxID=1353009 RepID=A0A1Y2IBC2_TRAC3|nr:hypothetical protein PYCCODRAFT_1398369 [Trametes coccinea BRFM310]